MRTRNSITLKVALLSTILLALATFSFVRVPGGDHFEVYLNKKLVFQQIVSQPSGVKSLVLNESNMNDKVEVFYSHCGKIGTKRNIVIKDGNNVLRQWRFVDVVGNTSEKKFMSMNVKEILAFKARTSDKTLNLYYSSQEMPDGRLLASIVLDTENKKVEP